MFVATSFWIPVMKTTKSFISVLRKTAFLAFVGSALLLGGCAQYTFQTPQGPAYAYGPIPSPAPVQPVYVAPRYAHPDDGYRYERRDDYGYVAPPARVYAAPAQPCGPGLTPNRVLGGIAGGLLGSMIGRGNGRIAASAAGAIIGSSAGGC